MLNSQDRTLGCRVSLTFDDGPCAETTPVLLDHLNEAGVKATFFVVGRNIVDPKGRAIVERIAAEGHQIGNHTYNHTNLTRLDAPQIEYEIKQTEDLIGALDNGIKLFRPPFGHHNAIVDRTVEALGYKLVLWNVCALDWRAHYQNRRWVAHVLKQIKADRDYIILAHDLFSSTVEYIPDLVKALRRVPGTEFVLAA